MLGRFLPNFLRKKHNLQQVNLTFEFVTSHVSGRGNVLRPVGVSVCVCLSVSTLEAKGHEVKVTEENLSGVITVR